LSVGPLFLARGVPIAVTRTLIAFALACTGCGFNQADIPVETPPLQVGPGTTPADSTEFLFDPNGLDLVVGFQRPVEGPEVTTLKLVPTPEVMGPILNPAPNPRQIVLQKVVLDTIFPSYRLIIDGPTMNEPEVVSYYSRNKSVFHGAIQGRVFMSRASTGNRAIGAVVYALVPPGLEGDFDLHGGEDTILGQPIVGATKALSIPTEEGAWFRLGGLLLYRRYLVLAILDTNNDGEYELDADWWGYYRDGVDAAVEVISGVALGSTLEPPLPELKTDTDFWILPPGSLSPVFN
jgi:hypothetical protein